MPAVDVVDPDPRRDRHAVPPAGPVVDELVAERPEVQRRRLLVGELRLLHAQDVRLVALGPGQHPLEAGLQRVDVPGREAHRFEHRPTGAGPTPAGPGRP